MLKEGTHQRGRSTSPDGAAHRHEQRPLSKGSILTTSAATSIEFSSSFCHNWRMASTNPPTTTKAKALLEGFHFDLSRYCMDMGAGSEKDGALHAALRADGDIFPMVELLLRHKAPIDIL